MSDRNALHALMSVLQEPIGLTPRPFSRYARRLGLTEDQVIAEIRKHMRRGVIRRFAGIVKHDRAGYRHNAMVVFPILPHRCDKAGAAISRFPFVSHCYRRTPRWDWPYTLYAMVHARTRGELSSNLKEMSDAIPHATMTVLKTVKEFKKTRFRLTAKRGIAND
jgi:siroheme decarboxylase